MVKNGTREEGSLRRQRTLNGLSFNNKMSKLLQLSLCLSCCSILGMHIFGCKFSLKTDAGDTVPDRKNFDSLLWAIVTVFQVLQSRYKKTSRIITPITQHQCNICTLYVYPF